ncbi:MAG: dehydrogenase, partial [Verrucomicrobiales bacterium]|nr:dehydrogenase [Verrucomicrobiales bacterium]
MSSQRDPVRLRGETAGDRSGKEAMKYLCLVYLDEKMRDALPRAELEAWIRDAFDNDEALRKSGHFLASQALQSVQTATTLRVRGGKMSLNDGPFAETKEQLAGFILIEARDLNEAINAAAKIPG